MFRLHDRIAADTVEVARLPLCRLQLMNDSRFPWLILVPAREGITEFHQLWDEDYHQLMDEIVLVSRCMERLFKLDNLNVAALGNMVPQLHVHIVSRRREDDAWPGPVWGAGKSVPYEKAVLTHRLSEIRAGLEGEEGSGA